MAKMKIKELLEFLTARGEKFEFKGNENEEVYGFSSLKNYKRGTFTWIKNSTYIPQGMNAGECTLIITQGDEELPCKNAIYSQMSKRVFFSLVEHFSDVNRTGEADFAIGNNTYIAPGASLGENIKIGHNCTIDGEVSIGGNCSIGSNVSILGKVEIGQGTTIQSGVRIGDADLSYVHDAEGCRKMVKHYGGVKIGENVYIGANTAISRGTIDDTVIGDETSIDALCHISHNCVLGKKNTIVDGSYLYGSVETGDNVYIASSIIMNQMKLGDNVTVGMNSVVMSNIESGNTVVGTPAKKLIRKISK